MYSFLRFSDFLTSLWMNSSFRNLTLPKSVSYHFRALHPESVFPSPTPSPSEVFTLVVCLLGCVCVKVVEESRGANHGSLRTGGSCWLGPLEPNSSACVMPVALWHGNTLGDVVNKAAGGPGPSSGWLEESC